MASYSDDPQREAELERQIKELMQIPDNAMKKIGAELAKSPRSYLHAEDKDNWVVYIEWRGMSASFWSMTPDRARQRADEWLKKVGYYTPEDEN